MGEKSISVLLVEDNQADARLIREVLDEESSQQFKLEHSTRLETAMARLDQGGIDLVLLDLSLPDSQGIETFKQMRIHSARVPIVVLTGLRDECLAAEALLSGGQDFLKKGALNFCGLATSIRHAIERHRARRHAYDSPGNGERSPDEILSSLLAELRPMLLTAIATISDMTDRAVTVVDFATGLSSVKSDLEHAIRWIEDLLAHSQAVMPSSGGESI